MSKTTKKFNIPKGLDSFVNMTQRYENLYHGYKIIADHWKGKIQGRAYFGCSNDADKSKTISSIGSSIEDVVQKLKEHIDELNLQQGRCHEQLHKEYLESIGKRFNGYIDGEMPRSLPEWHCYSCKTEFAEFQGLRCAGCGAEVCPHCGTCHCGYLGEYKYR